MISPKTKIRIARPTNDLQAISSMYVSGLGYEQIGGFEDHDGIDGIMLGHPQHNFHLEFSYHRNSEPIPSPHPDQVLVFYLPDYQEWEKSVRQMKVAGFREVESFNPYWDLEGKTFEDLDGYRIVIQNQAWNS